MTGVVKGSYIPTGEIKELRELTEHRKKELKEKLGRNLNDVERLELKQLVGLLKSLENMVKEVEGMIIFKVPEPVIELSKVLGVGLITAATIYAEFGDISRFPNSKAAKAYAGFAPKTKQSGDSESHSGMIRGNKRLRRGFYLVARVARGLGQFEEYYERLIAREKSVKQATCALGGKFACICYHVLKDGVYKGDVKKSFRVSRGRKVGVKNFNVGDALDSLSQ
ncbi:hypothetical protein HS5_02900 [Acidianus sp. HS-5]|nr:hypothetical protein HS5_02900 [Acidianus sp. HS-5]